MNAKTLAAATAFGRYLATPDGMRKMRYHGAQDVPVVAVDHTETVSTVSARLLAIQRAAFLAVVQADGTIDIVLVEAVGDPGPPAHRPVDDTEIGMVMAAWKAHKIGGDPVHGGDAIMKPLSGVLL